MHKDVEQYRDIAIKSLAVLGLMTILALGSFLTLTVLSYIPKMVRSASHFVASKTPDLGKAVIGVASFEQSNLSFKTNKASIASGGTVTLSWDKSSSDMGGSYTLSYPCMSGVYVSYKGSTLSCNVPLNIDQDSRDISLSISSKKLHSADVAFALRFTKNGEEKASSYDSLEVNVVNNSIASSNSGGSSSVVTKATSPVFSFVGSYNAGTPSYAGVVIPSNNPVSVEWGQADLRPVILEIGVVDPTTKEIIPTKIASRTSKIGVRFAVENIGTKTSQPWVFNAVLPTSPRYTYLPEFQPPLKPGERIEYTLSFTRSVAADNTVTITVDPAETLPEATKTNNVATVNFTAF